jgi:hypothetical protein
VNGDKADLQAQFSLAYAQAVASVAGFPPTLNTSTTRVQILRANVFDATALTALMTDVARGVEP